jgi:hypothetical protein
MQLPQRCEGAEDMYFFFAPSLRLCDFAVKSYTSRITLKLSHPTKITASPTQFLQSNRRGLVAWHKTLTDSPQQTKFECL